MRFETSIEDLTLWFNLELDFGSVLRIVEWSTIMGLTFLERIGAIKGQRVNRTNAQLWWRKENVYYTPSDVSHLLHLLNISIQACKCVGLWIFRPRSCLVVGKLVCCGVSRVVLFVLFSPRVYPIVWGVQFSMQWISHFLSRKKKHQYPTREGIVEDFTP